ncbi:hypothetical protein GT370_00930 [Acidocella sp. MX-AZ03]|uniref:hypothetical protein n=1 Tax=Acidocella sp. MX-AZ03 TaxID=2697363 RepID=UPI0022DD55B4|nr:hypothetical protein [Acidocella sp. MX-AZ03]WBO59544.1 hypothetical protein GT370_00930 [Acidocella sp. MX-AZ03]
MPSKAPRSSTTMKRCSVGALARARRVCPAKAVAVRPSRAARRERGRCGIIAAETPGW